MSAIAFAHADVFAQARAVVEARSCGASALTASLCAAAAAGGGGAATTTAVPRWTWLQNVMEGLAGVGGGLVGLACVFPLERLSALMQTDTSGDQTSAWARLVAVLRAEGWAGVYQGFQSGLVAMLVTMYIFFSAHGFAKRATLAALNVAELGALSDLFAATVAGAVTAVASNPVWLVNTRLMLQNKKNSKQQRWLQRSQADDAKGVGEQEQEQGIIACFLSLYKEGGAAAYFRGVGPALGTVSNTGLQFMAYEQMRKVLVTRGGGGKAGERSITGFQFFVIGAIAKMFSTVVTYPLQTITRRMQQPDEVSGKPRYRSTAQCARAATGGGCGRAIQRAQAAAAPDGAAERY